jgi:hypothetical protein
MSSKKRRQETTSARVAAEASRVLRDPNASAEAKSVAASALTQREKTPGRHEGKKKR